MKRIRVVIIDDDPLAVKVLSNALDEFDYIEIVAESCHLRQAKDLLMDYKPDLLFLDVEFPNMTGLDFLSSVKADIDWPMKTVFYTAFEQYMLQALRLQAFDYLVKPLIPSDLNQLMERLSLQMDDKSIEKLPLSPDCTEKPLMVTSATNGKVVLRVCNIGYFRYNSQRKLWEIVLDSQQCIALKHNTTADTILNYNPDFVQIHKIYIININYLSLIQDNSCIMAAPFNEVTELKIGRNYRKALLDRFYDL